MKYRELGDTGLNISEIGFGAWGIGGDKGGAVSYGPTDDDVSIDALNAALENGINFYETSSMYGFGHSEYLIGKAFKERRGDVIIATKAGWGSKDGKQDFSPEALEQSLNESLKYLDTDYVDLFQLHAPPIEELQKSPESVEYMKRAQKEGKTRALGISVRNPKEGIVAIEEFGFKSILVNFNMMDVRVVEDGLLEVAKKHNAGIIARTPLCFGFLTGTIDHTTEFAESDHRSRWNKDQLKAWAEGNKMLRDSLKSKYPGQTDAQIALRFCLSFENVVGVIPGMMNREEVIQNAVVGEMGPLENEDRDKLLELGMSGDFFVSKGKHWAHKEA